MKHAARRAVGGLTAAAFLLAGCADLKVHKLDAADQATPLRGKFTYYLPRAAISIAVSVAVTECGKVISDPTAVEEADPDNPGSPSPTKKIAFKVSGSTAFSLEADPNYEYWIDYDKARSWLKEINFTVNTAPTKVFQSYSGQINDQAGPIAVAALTTATQIAGAAMISSAPRAAVKSTDLHIEAHAQPVASALVQAPDSGDSYCDAKVMTSLKKVSLYRSEMIQLNKKIDNYRAKMATAANLPSKNDPTSIWASAVSALQAQINAETTKSLTQTMTYKWYPGSESWRSVNGLYVGEIQEPISNLVLTFLSPKGKQWFENAENNDQTDVSSNGRLWYKAHAPYMSLIAINPSTFFDETAYKNGLKSGQNDPLGTKSPNGLLIRDPATGFVQRCTLVGNSASLAEYDRVQALWKFTDESAFTTCFSKLNSTVIDQSANSDDSTRINVSVPQFGRVLVFDQHSALFEDANLAVTLNADGTIQTVSTHDLSTAATGLSGLGSAASAASTAEAARNTAITAVNTAVTTQAQLPDTINKALADCLAQAKTIQASGITPAPCQ